MAACMATRATQAGQVRVAVAANFRIAATEIGKQFTKTTGHKAIFSFGPTGQLYAQISQGAPFDVFLAADQARPKRAVENGLAVAGSRFTYAVGRLALFSLDKKQIEGPATLKNASITRIAIANPDLAPYGAAAVEVMKMLGVYARNKAKIVRGISVAQAYQFVHTGNAEIGFVALSQIVGHRRGSRWIVPAKLHSPIAQDAVLLKRGADNQAARAFLRFLKGVKARAIKMKYGYGAGEGAGNDVGE